MRAADGSTKWLKTATGSAGGFNEVLGVAAGSAGQVVAAGQFSGATLTFPPLTALTNVGAADVFVAGLLP